jgi:hypothetical protein
VIDPTIGMTPNDWAEAEARRRERHERVHNPHGRELGHRSRAILTWLVVALVIATMAAAALVALGVIALPVLEPPPAP